MFFFLLCLYFGEMISWLERGREWEKDKAIH